MLKRAWGVDELYSVIFGAGGGLVAAESAMVDKQVIDGAVNGVGTIIRTGASYLRRLQSGFVRSYALFVGVGAALLLALFLTRASL